MIPKSLYEYYFFGNCVRYLQGAKAGVLLHNKDHTEYLLSIIARFFIYLDELNLQVTQRASSELRELYNTLSEKDEDTVLNTYQADRLKSIMGRITPTLEAEIQGFNAYVVTPKRIETSRLLSDVASLFAPEVFARLPQIARYDLDEAGKCTAFERPTASAFHLLRATESVLKTFYCLHVKRGRVTLMWGPMVQSLQGVRKLSNSKDLPILFNNLDNIRRSFRNPTQHPEKIYEIQEVLDLWGLCIDVINRMAKSLPPPKKVTEATLLVETP